MATVPVVSSLRAGSRSRIVAPVLTLSSNELLRRALANYSLDISNFIITNTDTGQQIETTAEEKLQIFVFIQDINALIRAKDDKTLDKWRQLMQLDHPIIDTNGKLSPLSFYVIDKTRYLNTPAFGRLRQLRNINYEIVRFLPEVEFLKGVFCPSCNQETILSTQPKVYRADEAPVNITQCSTCGWKKS